MKLIPVNYRVVRENANHPLHELYKETLQLNCDDAQSVQQFFQEMTVPEGYFAMVTNSFGCWIDFYEPFYTLAA